MSEIHCLAPERYKQPFEPHAPLVEMLEQMLVYAKEGKMRAAAFAVVYHDDLVPDGEVTEGWQNARGTRFALSHGIGRLHHDWYAKSIKEAP